MSSLSCLLLVSSLVSLALSSPFYPTTCYSKALSLKRELTHMAAYLKRDPETTRCMAHMPELYLDIHNACVMYKLWNYISLVEGLRQRRCAYTREVRKLEHGLRQLFIILGEKCRGDLVFRVFDCAALERYHTGW
ncbi:CYTL1 domain-containing protein isoform X2 [Kryptolebias marmoratus]|uniref:Zmp:0000001268 n=1 Tax=Kryptolebias marmoratus TaxID=37003 RepID=A0A3Q3AFC8_KRYMA|nr:CYTL1 domain-containing protein isoform X2 [Kryptolebias marmoratus]